MLGPADSGNRVILTKDGDVQFWCPGCEDYHGVRGLAWTWNGDPKKPTLGSSVLVRGGHYANGDSSKCWCTYEERYGKPPPFSCITCHCYVRDGRIQYLLDSTHKLAGQIVDMRVEEGAA